MPHDVFISHASGDASVAAEVCALLEARGVKCWIAPRDVAARAVWDEAILDRYRAIARVSADPIEERKRVAFREERGEPGILGA